MTEQSILIKQGFSRISNVLDQSEIIKLRQECTKIINSGNIINYKIKKNDFINDYLENYDNTTTQETFFKTKARAFVGASKLVDTYLEMILYKSKINKILEDILIKPKLSTCIIRLANNESHYLGFHTDSDSTLSLSIFLDDVSNEDATTTFIPRSHLYPQPLKNKIEKINPKYFKFISKNSIGKAGDITLFFNRVVHGVKSADKGYDSKNMVLLLNFHSDYDITHRNLSLQDKIKYDYQPNKTNNVIHNYFDFVSDERVKRLQKKNSINIPIKKIFTDQNISLRDSLTYYFLLMIAFFLKYLIIIYRKFFKNILNKIFVLK